MIVSAMARRVAVRYRQKGKAKRKRQQRYRKTRTKSIRQSAQWRKRNKSKVRRYERQRTRNPSKHRLRRAELLTFAEQIPYWDMGSEQEGQLVSVLPEDDKVTVLRGDEEFQLDLFEFLDNAVFMDEADEVTVFELLDPLYEYEGDEGA